MCYAIKAVCQVEGALSPNLRHDQELVLAEANGATGSLLTDAEVSCQCCRCLPSSFVMEFSVDCAMHDGSFGPSQALTSLPLLAAVAAAATTTNPPPSLVPPAASWQHQRAGAHGREQPPRRRARAVCHRGAQPPIQAHYFHQGKAGQGQGGRRAFCSALSKSLQMLHQLQD